jgi:hypothetical protein
MVKVHLVTTFVWSFLADLRTRATLRPLASQGVAEHSTIRDGNAQVAANTISPRGAR